MCGIVGYAGHEQAASILLEGLSKLEYRGYDSAGLCVYGAEGLQVEKSKGRLQILFDKCEGGKTLQGMAGIGHTRWATHGAPSDINSHPQLSQSGKIAVVHNGIVENEAQLRRWLCDKGTVFKSQTDTEVIANLIDWHYGQTKDFAEAIRRSIARLQGSFALGILCEDLPETVIAVKRNSPLIFGYGKDAHYVASDATAIMKYTRKISYLDDDEMAIFTAHGAKFYDAYGKTVEKKIETISWEMKDVQLGGYDHFMLKEIYEQPNAVRDTILPRIKSGRVELEGITLTGAYLKSLKKIYLVACGSAYYVSLVAKYMIEKYCRIPTEAVMASEFRYGDPVVDGQDLVIVISQSGETADSLAALREAKRRGARTLAIVNVVGSAIAKEADDVLYTWAGPEISVATTKAFSTQLVVIYLLTLAMADVLGTVNADEYTACFSAICNLPEAVENALSVEQICKILAAEYCGRSNAFYIGRNVDSAVCLEGSLKLKEIAYLHSEAYPAGELKHGPISLIEQGTLVVAVATVDGLFDKTMANVKEVKARGAEVVLITTPQWENQARSTVEHVIVVPKVHPMVQPSLSLLPLQMLAYHIASYRGCDVDKPRNLAKSVTVE